ncbi:MAG TPA: hypothetical protein VKS21_09170, partial [Spirochaetota bacterium]|nr:hypothetical protein [Spirochaetota bacterium]
ENFYEKNPNSIACRKLLFKIYLAQNQYDRAQKQLNFLLKSRKGETTDLMAASYYYRTGNLKLCKKYLDKVLLNNKRNIKAYILLARLAQQKKHYKKAAEYLQEAEIIDQDHPQLLYAYCHFLLTQNKFKELKQKLKVYQKKHPEDPDYFYLYSMYLFQKKQYTEAQKYIEKALYYKPFSDKFKKQHIKILLQLQKYDALIKSLQKTSTAPDARLNYKIAYYNYLRQQKDHWRLADKKYLKYKVLQYLDKSLDLDQYNETVRYFTELLVLNNYPLDHPERKKYSAYHLKRAVFFQERGVYEKAYAEYIRLLQLVPQDSAKRIKFADFLKKKNFNQSYLEELTIIKKLSLEADYKITHKLEKMKVKMADAIHNRYNLEPDSAYSSKPRVILLKHSRPGHVHTEGIINIFYDMLYHTLQQCYKLKTLPPTTAADIKNTQHKSDYYIKYDFREQPGRLELTAAIYNSKKNILITRRKFFTDGNNKFFDINILLKKYLKKNIKARGIILKKDFQKLIVSLGERDGFHKDDRLAVYKNLEQLTEQKQPLTFARITEINEKYSVAVPEKFYKNRYLKNRQYVVRAPQAEKK